MDPARSSRARPAPGRARGSIVAPRSRRPGRVDRHGSERRHRHGGEEDTLEGEHEAEDDRRPHVLARVRRQPGANARAPGPTARTTRPQAALVARPRRLRGVPAELLRRHALRQHASRTHLRDRRRDREGALEAQDPGVEAVDARDRRPTAHRHLQGRNRHEPRSGDRQAAVAADDELGCRILAGGGGRPRLFRSSRRKAVRRELTFRSRPLGVRHRRKDQRQSLRLRPPRLRHDVRGWDLLPRPGKRTQALEHLHQARPVPVRQLLLEPVDRRSEAVHDLPLGKDRRG